MHRITLLGIDFGRAPLAVREDLSFTAQQSESFYASFAEVLNGGELIILSTCNRAEFYLAAADPEAAENNLLQALRRLRPSAKALDSSCNRYRYAGPEAVGHMMAVAAGLRSQVRGDPHVGQQLRQAAGLAAKAGAAGPTLHAAVQASLRAARRVRSETGIGTGAASVGASVLGAIRTRLGTSACRHVLVAGSGQAAADVAVHLAKQRFASLWFTARRAERAQELADSAGGQVLAWDQAAGASMRADVVITALSCRLPWLERGVLQGLRQTGGASTMPPPLLIVDLGVPRNADPGCASLPGVSLVDLDQIQRELAATLAAREENVAGAERIISQELDRYLHCQRRLAVQPAIRDLYRQAEAIRLSVLADCRGGDAPEVARLLMKKLLDGPVRRLRRLAAVDQSGAALAASVLVRHTAVPTTK